MNVAAWCPRAPHIKILGPVLAEAKRRGHTLRTVVPTGDPKGDGAWEHAHAELGTFGPVERSFRMADSRPDWVVAVGLRTGEWLRSMMRPCGVKWLALDHCGDNLTYLLEGTGTVGWDVVTTLSEEARQATIGLSHGYAGHDVLPIGYPELDQLGLPGMNRKACRTKWGIPANVLVVLLGPAARPAALGRGRRWWFGLIRYRQVVRGLRAWCDRHGALLIAKTRIKHRDRTWLRRACHQTVGDVSFYPFTTLELLLAADCYVGFASAMAIEACAVGQEQLHLHGWPMERGEWPSAYALKRLFFAEPAGLWNCPGSYAVPARWTPLLDRMLDTMVLGDWHDLAPMRDACERWAGPLDGRASARVIDLLETRR